MNARFTQIRATSSHLDAVLDIEQRCFPDPWSRSSFEAELDRSWSWFHVIGFQTAGESVPDVAGYLVCWLFPDELQVLRTAIDPEFRRRGLASALLVAALDALSSQGGGMAHLEVRESNLAARGCYARLGFEAGKKRPAYYRQGAEDAIVMARQVPVDWRRLE